MKKAVIPRTESQEKDMKQSYASIKFVDPSKTTTGSLKWVNGSKITRGDLEKHFSNDN